MKGGLESTIIKHTTKCPNRATASTRSWRKPQSCTFTFCSNSSPYI